MNYRHAFHAGNFADVCKHIVLSLLLTSLHRKATPFCYLDTHAGCGRYDLLSEAAQKTAEYQAGIQRLWPNPKLPEAENFLAAVHALNSEGVLRYYPGSPRLARFFLRPQDRMLLVEAHGEEVAKLKSEFEGDRQVVIQQQDAYASLKALLPPQEKRGLVLIDPPYESAQEFEQLVQGLRIATERWASGIYAIWYPIKNRPPIERLHRSLIATGIRKMLLAEFCPYPDDSALRLNGCGMIIVNPPWQLEQTLKTTLPALLALLRQHARGRTDVSWLVGE
ncbi:MAG: 23S rRNA (adenine(2030)-N(6))-methyltransferase RlmJ [Gammaproteobacteria bacterium]|nr:23S rRNA (adenine(2030)-N(6))-methyltransferase RlmJ [Gammaproteobacteria bacterium]